MDNRLDAKSEKKTGVYKPSRATQLFTVWGKLKKSKLALLGGFLVLFMVAIALLAPIIAPYDPKEINYARGNISPSQAFLFGTDVLGRDVLSWVIWGTRVSLYVGFGSVLIELLIGICVGMIAGYFGGRIDEILMRVADVILSMPILILLLVAVAMFAVRTESIIIMIMGLLGWPFMARVVRSEFLSLKEANFVEAARSMGATNWRIMLRHILPGTLSSIVVLVTIDIPSYILWEAALTFLGLGDPSAVSWAVLLTEGRPYLRSAWWITTFPGLAIFFTSLGFNLLGDGLRDALDVKTRV